MATTTREECVAVIALLAISLGAFVINKKRTSRRRRRWQVRPVNINRPLCQFSLFRQMKNVDSDEFFKYTRMNVDLFHELLRHVWRRLYKPHGRAINPEMKLALTLKYLAQGGSIQSMASDYNILKCTARKIILEVCTAIWEELKSTYMASSSSYPEWLQIANRFWEKWQFPLCLGAIDDVGAYGSDSDATILSLSAFGSSHTNNPV
ncbi:uncharacterized protein [Centruroides vittatus]|uniref:uncharacterized protein isoform X2 n=1 Tax=Centruroides vittatus TaxID=120091 RepID=UPI00350FE2A1